MCEQEEDSMGKIGTGQKLQNISEIYVCHTSREKQPTHLTDALACEMLEKDSDGNLHVLDREERAVRVVQLLEANEGVTRAYSLLHRDEDGRLLSNEQVIN